MINNDDLQEEQQENTANMELAKDQRNDPTLTDVWKRTESKDPEFSIIQGILFRNTKDQAGAPHTQLVLPLDRREKVLRTAHFTPMAGHLGYKKTKHIVMKNFFWPNMSKQIRDACQTCSWCQHTAKKTHPLASMQKTPTYTEPFHKVALDTVGPLPMSKLKHQFILNYIDLQLATLMPNL